MIGGFNLRSLTLLISSGLAAFLTLQSIYVAYVGPWDIAYGRNMLVCIAIVVALLVKPAVDSNIDAAASTKLFGTVLDLALLGVIVAASVRFT